MPRVDLRRLVMSVLLREEGATATEYAIVLVLVAVGAVAALAAFGGHLTDYWAPISSAF
jgi:Flp pilus assembly pilin Flp